MRARVEKSRMRASTAAKPAILNPSSLSLDTSVATLSGIGPKRAAALADRGIATVGDLIFHLPSRYQDWRRLTPLSALAPGTVVTVEAELGGVSERPMRGAPWRRLASGWLSSAAARVRVVWFNLPGYMRGKLPSGERVLAHGRVTQTPEGNLEILQPEIHPLSTGTPPPVRPYYNLPAGMSQRVFSGIVVNALREVAQQVGSSIPEEVHHGHLSVAQALAGLHQPSAGADVGALNAGTSQEHLSLAFDELFAFELALGLERERAGQRPGVAIEGGAPKTDAWLKSLPFRLTGAQARAIGEISADLARPTQMNRMLLGDVGSGKTLVGFWAAVRAIEAGYQVAMMAPTELLAEQHHTSFQRLCGNLGIPAALLTGKVQGSARARLLHGLNSGALPIVFGTHAIIQERVRVSRLGLGIIDEQHRFGVFDRAKLKALGPGANLLMMTATPIPRSLALSLFANLNISFLDELPPGRTPVETLIFDETNLDGVDEIVRGELAAGNRAYYVLPRIDAPDEERRSVTAAAERLKRGRLKEYRVEVMHGRMSAADKERVMARFRDGAVQVLVSTTVVEVGIDVPEATVMAIIAAERYGLAQLHQLRGRVGRGNAAARCCLVASGEADDAARERLRLMTTCTTGGRVAEADLRLRGPGDLLGARQTGALPLRFVHLVRDYRFIERSRELAEGWLKNDPDLQSLSSASARKAIRRMLSLGFSLGDVG
jgi:ATP-dependent DNA helicase RecG